jgi:hypothetical protein
MSDQWVDLNGAGWLAAVVGLYARDGWQFLERRRTGYSVVLFGPPAILPEIDPAAVAGLAQTDGVSSIQIAFDQALPADTQAMPPGGFRRAIINCWDLRVGTRVRSQLQQRFGPIS